MCVYARRQVVKQFKAKELIYEGTAILSVIDKLLIVQEYDCSIYNMEKEIRDIPVRKEREKFRLDKHKQVLAEDEKNLKFINNAQRNIPFLKY